MDVWQILLILLIAALVIRWFGWLKGLPVKKATAGILALLLVGVGIYAYDWMGIKSALVAPAPPAPIKGIPQFSVLGSESADALLYDSSTRTFNMKIRENTTGTTLQLYDYANSTWLAAAADPTVTFTLTLYREDTDPNAQIGEARTGTMPTFTVSGDVNVYSVIDKTADDKWEVEVTPAGGSARYEYNTALVSGGSSKAFDVKVYFDYSAVNKATDGTIHTATFSGGPPGTDFRLNVTVEPAVT